MKHGKAKFAITNWEGGERVESGWVKRGGLFKGFNSRLRGTGEKVWRARKTENLLF